MGRRGSPSSWPRYRTVGPRGQGVLGPLDRSSRLCDMGPGSYPGARADRTRSEVLRVVIVAQVKLGADCVEAPGNGQRERDELGAVRLLDLGHRVFVEGEDRRSLAGLPGFPSLAGSVFADRFHAMNIG